MAAAIGAIAAAVMYGPVVFGLFRQWYDDPDAAYGLVVVMAAAIVVRRRWVQLRSRPPRPCRWGPVALVGSAALYLAGVLAGDVFALRLSLIAMAAAAVSFVYGAAHLRLLQAPFALALLAVPLPAVVVTELTMPLQLMASRCAVVLLDLAEIPVLREGNVLTLSHVRLEVAQACSGMRSIVTLLALIGVVAALRGMSLRVAAALAAAALPVALAGNGLRIAFTGVLASHIGERAARGVVHDATGWAAFVLMGAALFGLQWLVGRGAVNQRRVFA